MVKSQMNLMQILFSFSGRRLVLLSIFGVLALNGQPAADKVEKIPGYDSHINFDIYSGYLSVSDGHLFYFLTESSHDASADPLVLWLNGGLRHWKYFEICKKMKNKKKLCAGPGCSSLIGQFRELGPFHAYREHYQDWNGKDGPDKSQKASYGVEYNPYTFNSFANILFLESPMCVGFSYPNSMDCTTFVANDNTTATYNYEALQAFMAKFPQYVNNNFYIAGESYAGHYIPQLTWKIIQENKKIKNGQSDNIYLNIKSIAIGNPSTEHNSQWFEGLF
ncbi:hypothetical protein RFI_20807 [Reticulomyxa filosa]|uniref:Carboxypeptidase n=1 Tax=Reticulomyxa filosa TaxID=46433 RepID=X6MRU0_RETFI|nr:hypothetical protein RFI_20807 [Reticulomyxa filosa]|eukprot:ETO16534.1 hypothetical protein RFI_20807 [Reticulomyxa filosa]